MADIFAQPVVEEIEIEPDNFVGVRNIPEVSRESKVDVPVSIYKNINDIPYTCEYFSIKGYDFDAIKRNVDVLDSFILKQISDRELKDTTGSYEQIIQEIFNLLGIEENTRNEIKFNKCVQYINFLGRADKVKKTRNAMKKYLNNK